MKKTLAVLLAAMLCTCMFSGCGKDSGKDESSTSAPAVESKAETETKTESKTEDASSGESKSEEKSKAEEASKADESSEEVSKDYAEIDKEYEYTTENGIIVVKTNGHYRAMEMFGGGTGDAYVDALNSLRGKLDSNIKMYSVIAPLASEFYTPDDFSERTADQKAFIDDIAARLNDGIAYVDIDTVLAQHADEDIYCRTDHHWMPLGAFYAAQELAKAAGTDFKPMNTFTPKTINDFVGTMYAFTDGDINIKNDPEDFTYYVPDNYAQCDFDFYDTSFNFDYSSKNYFKEIGDPQSNAYLTFFGGDEQIVKIRSNVKNGRKLLVVKDSYGNAVPSNLMNSFEEIYIIDMRYFNLNLVNFINTLGITDVAFVMCVFSAFGGNSYDLPNLITQNPDEAIVDTYDNNTEE